MGGLLDQMKIKPNQPQLKFEQAEADLSVKLGMALDLSKSLNLD